MRQSLSEHLANGGRYAPPPTLRALGALLSLDDEIPTLFRWPGPHAVAAALRGEPGLLAPSQVLWLHGDPAFTWSARLFGVLAIPNPAGLQLVRAPDGAWVGANLAVDAVWIPPASFGLDFDALADVDAVRAAIPDYPSAASAGLGLVGAYLEELSSLSVAGAPPPPRPWCELSASDRLKILASAGVAGRWTT
jgi:hypothetical protein